MAYYNYPTSANPFYNGHGYASTSSCGRYPPAGPSYTKAPTHANFSLGYSSPPTPAELLQVKHQLHTRLNDGRLSNMPAGFPFAYSMRSRGESYSKSRTTPYEFEEQFSIPTHSGYSTRRSVAISFSGPKVSNGPSIWRVHHVNADRKLHSSQSIPFAQVQVHPEVMATRYGRCVEKDSKIVLRALALSLELGVLVTITTQAALEKRPTRHDTVVYVGTTASGVSNVIYSTTC